MGAAPTTPPFPISSAEDAGHAHLSQVGLRQASTLKGFWQNSARMPAEWGSRRPPRSALSIMRSCQPQPPHA